MKINANINIEDSTGKYEYYTLVTLILNNVSKHTIYAEFFPCRYEIKLIEGIETEVRIIKPNVEANEVASVFIEDININNSLGVEYEVILNSLNQAGIAKGIFK